MGNRDRIWLCAGAIGISAMDVAVTLLGQPATYWAQGYQFIREDNGLANWLLAVHPAAFLAGNLIWVCSYCLAIGLLPLKAARTLAFTVMLGQGIAVSTWIVRYPFGPIWVAALIYLIRLFGEKVVWAEVPRSERPPRPGDGETVSTAD